MRALSFLHFYDDCCPRVAPVCSARRCCGWNNDARFTAFLFFAGVRKILGLNLFSSVKN